MTAQELLEALAAVPGVRRVPVPVGGLAESRLVGGVEIALATSADERALRRSWRERQGGGADPLLVVADDPDRAGSLLALGPLDAGAQLRLVTAGDLLQVLQRLPGRSALEGVRSLVGELERLDRAGIAGLEVRGLGTEHLYAERLRGTPTWSRLEEWSQAARGEWRELLTLLGYAVERQAGRNWLARHDGRPVALIRPMADPAHFARLDADGRPPEGVLIEDCLRAGARYGLLASAGRLRLFDARPATGGAITSYLELDAAVLAPEDRALIGLLAPGMLAAGGFAALMDDARAFGTALRRRVDQSIRQRVLPSLGRELGRWAARHGENPTDDEVRAGLEAAALTFVFRVLFLLYAESAGHLPVTHEAYRPHSLSSLVQEAAGMARDGADARATTLWRRVALLVEAMRTGNTAWGVPAYNGALFAGDGFHGAEALERVTLTDAALAPVLAALGFDEATGQGVDYSSFAIGHLGHIYEGLLSLRLSTADRDFRYDTRSDRYVAAEGSDAEVQAGELLWLTDEGGRKGGGVYYTPEPLVRHLVRRGVLPAFEEHLDRVAEIARDDPVAAADELLEFRVLDPACGSAHFLVAVVDELADRVARFLARTPLPAVREQLEGLRRGTGPTLAAGADDVVLLRRLVLKRCVYGVDRSEMGAEIAKLSLWLVSFVPGLSLAYLDHNVRVGDSLVGVAAADQLQDPRERHAQIGMAAQLARDAVDEGAEAARAVLALDDRTPDEVEASAQADRAARAAMGGARRLLDLWVAEPLGVSGGRRRLWQAPDRVVDGPADGLVDRATHVASEARALHWPLEFPEVFAGDRPGFDAVVGNPPWEEVTVEELAFFARYRPGLRALPEGQRRDALAALKHDRPELAERLAGERAVVAARRAYFAADTGYAAAPGDPDLYKFFCQRYAGLLAPGGALAVVLPRSTFLVQGSSGFRRWLLDGVAVERIDFLLNRGRWAFDTHPQYTVALLTARAYEPDSDLSLELAGVAASGAAFAAQSAAPGIRLRRAALGPDGEVPLLPSQAAAAVLAKLRVGDRFPSGAGRWRCFPVGELHERNDAGLWAGATDGAPLWKGESFDRFDAHGAKARVIPVSDALLRKVRKPRPGASSALARDVDVTGRRAAVLTELEGCRVAFRDVSRATDSRTVRAALIPPGVYLTNTAPYLAFVGADAASRALCLAVMNSLPFDWQARRFVETHVNFFVLELLAVPRLTDAATQALAQAAGRLSCPDERYADFAAELGVEVGPLDGAERLRLEVEIDAQVAVAWGLDQDELDIVLADFTVAAVSAEHRTALRRRLAELNGT